MSTQKYCHECRFFDPGSGRSGECRRRAPVPWPASVANAIIYGVDAELELDVDDFSPEWPNVQIDDWCGEFEPNEAIG